MGVVGVPFSGAWGLYRSQLPLLETPILVLMPETIVSSGRKPEEEGVEDNGLEENSGDGQVRAASASTRGGWAAGRPVMVAFRCAAGGC